MVRVDHASQLAGLAGRFADQPEVENLLLFADVDQDVVIPNLKRVSLLNIDADRVRSVSFPDLEHAGAIYLRGADITIADFPKLNRVTGSFYASSRVLQTIHVPNLTSIGDLQLVGNHQLADLSAARLYDVGGMTLERNPELSAENKDQLLSAGRLVTRAQRQAAIETQQALLAAKTNFYLGQRRQLEPTGHPTHFGTIGFERYSQWRRYSPRSYFRRVSLFIR